MQVDPASSSGRRPAGGGAPQLERNRGQAWRGRCLVALLAAAVAGGVPAQGVDGIQWSWTALYGGLGEHGLEVADIDLDGSQEVVVASSSTDIWHVLGVHQGELVQEWVAPYVGPIQNLTVAQLDDDPQLEVVVEHPGEIRVVDGLSRALERSIAVTVAESSAIAAGDLDADGQGEIAHCGYFGLRVYDAETGLVELDQPAFPGFALAVGQVDGDAQLELAVTGWSYGAFLVDAATGEVQWYEPQGFGQAVSLSDVDGDEYDELVATNPLRCFDLDAQVTRFILSGVEPDTVCTGELDGYPTPELVWPTWDGDLVVADAATGSTQWVVTNPMYDPLAVAIGDVDADTVPEVIWTSGGDASHVLVAEAGSTAPDLVTIAMSGVNGIDVADLDGDGQDELLHTVYTTSPHQSWRGGLVMIRDAATGNLEHEVSPQVPCFYPRVHDVRAGQLDADPQLEYCVSFTSDLITPGVACFDSSSHELQWLAEGPSYHYFGSMEIGDVDGDGSPEVVIGYRRGSSSDTTQVVAYRGASGWVRWLTTPMDVEEFSVLRLGEVDGDPRPEVVAGFERGVMVFDGWNGSLEAEVRAPDYETVRAVAVANLDGAGPEEILALLSNGDLWRVDLDQATMTFFHEADFLSCFLVADLCGDPTPDYLGGIRGYSYGSHWGGLRLLDGATWQVAWEQGPLGSIHLGEHDRLMLRNVDNDEAPEVVFGTPSGLTVLELRVEWLFSDGFESGDPSAWSMFAP